MLDGPHTKSNNNKNMKAVTHNIGIQLNGKELILLVISN